MSNLSDLKSQTISYVKSGWQPIPLHGQTKRPADSNWTKREYDPRDVIDRAVKAGHNVGVRMTQLQLVIDYDPRRDKSGKQRRQFEKRFPYIAPRVITGSGGTHDYLTLPAGVRVIDSIEGFDAFEFKSIGRQVVSAGSIHPDTGKPYKWDDFLHPDLSEAPECPANLLAAIKRPERAESVGGGHATPEQIARALSGLDVADFYDHDTWLKVMMACHHASAGGALEEFIAWSIGDPTYARDGDIISTRWDSLHHERDHAVTYATLNDFLRKAGKPNLQIPTDSKAAFAAFADDEDEAEDDGDTMDGFAVYPPGKRAGEVIAESQGNIRLALRKLKASVSHNTFSDRTIIEGLKGFGPHLDDAAMNRLWLLIDETFHFRPSQLFFETVVRDAARRKSINPARDYFKQVQAQWDGKRRLDSWLITYAGAKDIPYIRAVSALPLIAAVRRVRKPGVKYDEMLVLESEQGKDKSSALEILSIEKDWFSDSMPLNADNKLVIESLSGKLIVECADLHGLSRASVDHVKALLSRTVDRARMSYGRAPIERPRQNVFIGTANNRNYLKDKTGNRRFWPVAVKAFDLAALRRDRDQLWAEAAVREARGESIRLDRSLWAAAAVEQAKRSDTVADPFTDALRSALGDMAGKLSSEDAWTIIGLTIAGHRTQEHNDRLGAAMRHLGWQRRSVKINGDVKPGYVRGKKPFKRIHIARFHNGTCTADHEQESE